MPIISRIVSMVLRAVAIVCGAVVAGIIGRYLAEFSHLNSWDQARWIYTEAVAAVSILLGFLWLIPCSWGFFLWPIDVIISFAWFAAFGILVDQLKKSGCGGPWHRWAGITEDSTCGRWKASEAFSFISACVWLATALVGIWFTFRKDSGTGRRRWNRSAV